MTPEEVLEFFGTKYKFNKVTGMSGGSLLNWLNWGFVPEYSQIKIERETNFKLKTGEPFERTQPSEIK